MPQTRSAAKKRQTRLLFTPVPSSSPTAVIDSDHTLVRVDHSPTPSRMPRLSKSSTSKTKSTTKIPRLTTEKTSLPTPAPSSQLNQNDEESSSDSTQTESENPISLRIFGRHARPPPLQRSEFESPLPSASGQDEIEFTGNLSSPRKRTGSPSTNLRSSARLRKHSKSEGAVWKKTSPPKIDQRGTLLRKLRRELSDSENTISSADNIDPVKPTSKKTNETRAPAEMPASGSGGESSEDVVVSRRRRKSITRDRPDTPKTDSHSEASQTQVDNDVKEDLVDLSGGGKCHAEYFMSLAMIYHILMMVPRGQNPTNTFLFRESACSLHHADIYENRTRGKTINVERSNRQKQLEILKRRRDGGRTVELSSDSEISASSRTRPPPMDERGTHDSSSQDEDSNTDDDSATEAIRKSLRADADENDSCVDEDGFLGVHGLEDIPFELTRHAHKKPLQHFKDAVEWIVHNKLNPAFPRNDVIYRIAFRKIDDEVQGYSGSKFLSAAWNRDFLQALKTLPELVARAVRTMIDHKCDACNRAGHPAKHQLVFSGKPYDIDTLEELEDDDSDNEEVTSRAADTDQSRTFYLGR